MPRHDPRSDDLKRAPFAKKVEWFFSAIPHLGRTYRAAKLALRQSGEALTRAAALESDLRAEGERGERIAREAVGAAEALGDRIGEVGDRIDALQGRVEDLRARLGAMPEEVSGALDAKADWTAIGGIDRRLDTELGAIRGELRALREDLLAMGERGTAERAVAARGTSDLGRRLDLLRFGGPRPPEPGEVPAEGMEALLDSFYNRLEARFRGSREEIMGRLAKYLPDAEAAVARTGGRVLDLGCGRGEWLELLAARGVPAEGVDLNPMQVAEAREAGLPVVLGDACAHLSAAPDGSLAMVTAHHLVEHLPFRTVAWIAREAMAKLAPGGLLLIETPNPNTLLVGARSFHMDPTHLKPLPAEVLTVLLDTVGYHPVETRFLHPHEKLDTYFREKRIDQEVAGLLFGPQDLCVIGTRPAPAGGAA